MDQPRRLIHVTDWGSRSSRLAVLAKDLASAMVPLGVQLMVFVELLWTSAVVRRCLSATA